MPKRRKKKTAVRKVVDANKQQNPLPQNLQCSPIAGTRQNRLQIIQQRKQQVFNYPIAEKLYMLALYSACQAKECSCSGWKTPEENRHRVGESSYSPKFSDECRNENCHHSLQCHISHLSGISAANMNQLLCAVVDMEYLFMSKEHLEDEVIKTVYSYLYDQLRQNVLSRQQTDVLRGPIGVPPFELPYIARSAASLVYYKYKEHNAYEIQTMIDVVKIFIDFMNNYIFESPSLARAHLTRKDAGIYNIIYARWLSFCHVPAFCNSFKQFKTSFVFGRTLMRLVLPEVSPQLIMKCNSLLCDSLPANKRAVIVQMPKFLEALQIEILIDDSPIWDPAYRPTNEFLEQQRQLHRERITRREAAIAESSSIEEPGPSKKFKF